MPWLARQPLHCHTVQKKLNEFLNRVYYVNSENCEFLFWVEEVVLFGGMWTRQERVNNVDVSVRFKRKLDELRLRRLPACETELVRRSGRWFRSLLDQLHWAEHEVRLYVKNRSRAISLIQWTQNGLRSQLRVIYRRRIAAQPTDPVWYWALLPPSSFLRERTRP